MILEILWLKSTGTLKEHTRKPLKLTIEKIWCRQKTWAFFYKFVSKQTWSQWKKLYSNKKPPKTIHLWLNQFLNRIANVSVTLQYKNFRPKPDTQMKNLFLKNPTPISNTTKRNRSCIPICSFGSEHHLSSSRSKTCMHPKMFSFLWIPPFREE